MSNLRNWTLDGVCGSKQGGRAVKVLGSRNCSCSCSCPCVLSKSGRYFRNSLLLSNIPRKDRRKLLSVVPLSRPGPRRPGCAEAVNPTGWPTEEGWAAGRIDARIPVSLWRLLAPSESCVSALRPVNMSLLRRCCRPIAIEAAASAYARSTRMVPHRVHTVSLASQGKRGSFFSAHNLLHTSSASFNVSSQVVFPLDCSAALQTRQTCAVAETCNRPA